MVQYDIERGFDRIHSLSAVFNPLSLTVVKPLITLWGLQTEQVTVYWCLGVCYFEHLYVYQLISPL